MRPERSALAVAGAAVLVTGCGSAAVAPATHEAPAVAAAPRLPAIRVPRSSTCETAVAGTLGGVARRVYDEVAGGRASAQAARRIERSSALGDAVARGDARATRAVLKTLRKRQIVHIRILRGARVLVSNGRRPALAPVRGPVRDSTGRTVGSFVLTTLADSAYVAVTQRVTAGQILLRTGAHQVLGTLAPGPARVPARGSVTYRGRRYLATSFRGRAYPSGSLRISVLVPAGSQACAASAPATTAAVLGSVAKRIYQEEAAGPYVQLAVHHVQRSAAFRTAVARADPAAVRAEIVRFFQSHIHIVRVRAWRGNQLVNDVGGPFVLAPVTRALRTPGGRVVGRFSLAVQDDVGYAILVHRFTGAQVVMAMGARHVLGPTLPAGLPANGPAVVQGRRYRVVSLTGRAFPSGPLAITLLLPAG